MKKRTLLALGTAAVFGGSVFAQTAIDAYTITPAELRGSARFIGMGGAFTSLGSDLSCLKQNPAGIGLYRSSDIGLTFDISFRNSSGKTNTGNYKQSYTKAYFDNFYLGNLEYAMNIRPVLIQDVYYLDKEDWRTKITLNKVDTGAAHEQSYFQYLKTLDELYDEFRKIFSDKYDDDVFYDMCEATADIVENATAAYDLTDNYAPKYDMTEAEKAKYGDTLTMFRQLIEEGFRKLVPEGEEEKYRERVEYEKYVIESTDNVDYFLIQRDELNWAQENGILTGIGRGSAGGCLLLYLLGITFIDPLKYDLIFERFLLPERAGLEPDKVTIMAEDIQSSDYYELTLEDGSTLPLDKDATLTVMRNGELITVYADELKENDDIQFDNRDVLHNLPQILRHES